MKMRPAFSFIFMKYREALLAVCACEGQMGDDDEEEEGNKVLAVVKGLQRKKRAAEGAGTKSGFRVRVLFQAVVTELHIAEEEEREE